MRIDQAGALPMQPVLWNALGYQFEAASMLAALLACVVVRFWVCLNDVPAGVRGRAVNLSVMAIALLFTAGWVVLQRPSPFYALLSGSGFGALGSGIVAISLNWLRRLEPLVPDQEPGPDAAASDGVDHIEIVRRRARRAQHRAHHEER